MPQRYVKMKGVDRGRWPSSSPLRRSCSTRKLSSLSRRPSPTSLGSFCSSDSPTCAFRLHSSVSRFLLFALLLLTPVANEAIKFGVHDRHLHAEPEGNWNQTYKRRRARAPVDSFSDSRVARSNLNLPVADSEQAASSSLAAADAAHIEAGLVALSRTQSRGLWKPEVSAEVPETDTGDSRGSDEETERPDSQSPLSSSLPFASSLRSSSVSPASSSSLVSFSFPNPARPSDWLMHAVPAAFTEKQKGGGVPSGDGTDGKADDKALAFLGSAASASELNPPRLVRPTSSPSLPSREEQVRKAYALPLCEMSWDVLGPMLGAGTFGRVFPLKQPACTAVTKDFVGRKFAVKVFWLKRKGLINLFETIDEGAKPSAEHTDPDTITAIKSEIRSLPISSPSFQDMIRLADPKLDLEQIKAFGESLTVETVLKEAKALRTVINTNCFYTEVGETGTIFIQMEKFIKAHRASVWTTLAKATQEAQASKYAEIGLEENHWSLPLARVIVKDKKGVNHWALLIELFDGDLQPKVDKTGYALDGWNAKAAGNVPLREIFSSREALLGLTSKLVKPFVVMQNLYSLGHFDIKPPNLLYKYFPAANGRPARLSVAAGDFGMAGLLHSEMVLRGTLAFMAPEMERVSGGLVARPSFDVYALALTLAFFWTASTELRNHLPWVNKCIKPTLKSGTEFTFQRLASKSGPRIFEPDTIYALATCFAVGGKVEKLYHTGMPLLLRLKLSQMADPEPAARVSMRHARFVFKAFTMLDKLLRDVPSSANAERRENQLKQLQELHIVQFLLLYLRLEPLTAARDNTQSYWRLARALLDFARLEPIDTAATEAVAPLPFEVFAKEKDWKELKIEVSDDEVDSTIRKLRDSLTGNRSTSEEAWADLVDIAFGVSLEGLRTLVTRVVYSRKTFLVEQKIAKAVKGAIEAIYRFDSNTQLIAEDPPARIFDLVRAELGFSPPEDSEMGRFITHRTTKSFIAWATVDRLARQALRVALKRHGKDTQQVYEQFLAGEKPRAANAQAFYNAVFSSLEDVSQANYFGLPWDFATPSVFGLSAEEMQDYVRNTHLTYVAKMSLRSALRLVAFFLVFCVCAAERKVSKSPFAVFCSLTHEGCAPGAF
ncbi:putative protein kinase [Neospora caninum Liverpool]|uniref:Protein kinase domain-containing protein n=1 Tax=Neospora caninum (strain Liverpool) TaxID=572307 RepID=F0V8A2_NEOCL|nr:putative protein kinase [Neospora caninum Liverpool]CBZ49943.1 putative protein kinase [Neospora caninum Liverpool]|eukprot:XP_003879978.1 putative protein kinase [Neospora caninum Liverpool]